MPDIGEGLAEAEVARWLVAVGDQVAEDQPVVELMTDKAAVELPSPGAGVVVEQAVAEGQVVRVGAVLYVLESDVRIAGMDEQAAASFTAKRPEATISAAVPEAAEAAGVLAPPAVRRLAREMGVDLARVRGSGPHGRVTAEDVKAHATGTAAVAGPAAPAQRGAGAAPLMPGERVPLRGVQRRMAETMRLSARTIPHVTGFHELDAGAFQAELRRLREQAEAGGRRFPFDALLVRAAAIALREHPIFNCSLDDERGELVFHPDANVGVATATRDGLIVPVVKNAGGRDLDDLAAEVERVAGAARDGRVKVPDLQGGTFTISNTGAWRGGYGTSLIRPPEVAIVAFGRIEEKAVVRDRKIVVRPMLPMSVTFDHRVIDGEHGLNFALTLRGLIEAPEQIVRGA